MENLNFIVIIASAILFAFLVYFIIKNKHLKKELKDLNKKCEKFLGSIDELKVQLLAYTNFMKHDFTDPAHVRKILREVYRDEVSVGGLRHGFDDKDITKIKQALKGIFLLHFEKVFKLCAENNQGNSLISQIMWFDAAFLPPLAELSKKEGFRPALFEILNHSVEMVPDYEALEKLFEDVKAWGLINGCENEWKKCFSNKALILSKEELKLQQGELFRKTAHNVMGKKDALEISKILDLISGILNRPLIHESVRGSLKIEYEPNFIRGVNKLKDLAVDDPEILLYRDARKLSLALYPKVEGVETTVAQ